MTPRVSCLLSAVCLIVIASSRTCCSADNATASVTGSQLWDGLLKDCRGPKAGSYSCVQDTLQGYLEKTLDGNLKLTDSIVFTRNANKYSRESNARGARLLPEDEEPEFTGVIDGLEGSDAPRQHRSVKGISDILYNRAVKYLMTHDLTFSLPQTLFGGGTVRISPKSLEEDGGALIKLNIEDDQDPHQLSEPQPQGRIFKRIRQLLKKKLLTSFLAALLIIALIKVKLLFLAPLLLGVGTAKKILLKVLLFLFPALAHLFKLCAYYHHHHSKYHLHHHHQVNHHHHHSPQPVIHSAPAYHPEEYVYPEYPPGEIGHPPPDYGIHHRSELDENLLTSWGIDPPVAGSAAASDIPPAPGYLPRPANDVNRLYTGAHVKKASSSGGVRIKQHGMNLGVQYDPFYSPILERLDEVFGQLGFQDEGCKERLVCSMYKSPARFSPHSNLISAQLSRDPTELQRPAYSNSAVVRFYRYVQAARDGQDMKDCLTLYPACSVVTE